MKNCFKKILCIFMCVLVAISSGLSVVASASVYPNGVTEAQALKAIEGTDKLLGNVSMIMTGSDLQTSVMNGLYSDQTLSQLLVNTYTSLEEDGSELKMLGLKYSTADLANALANYPEVSKALSAHEKWSEVDLANVNWGVSTKTEFAEALGVVFSPFNNLLFCLLCSGTFRMNAFITLEGDQGYKNAVAPILKSLGCEDVLSNNAFVAQAKADKNSMVKNIVLPVLTMFEQVLEAPANNLSIMLPRFAHFVNSGEFNKCFNALLAPITTNPLVEIAVFLKLFDLESLTNIDVNQLLSSFSSEEGAFKMAELDFATLATCGKQTQKGFVSDKAAAFVEILRWLVETLKLNKDSLGSMFGTDANASTEGATDTSFLTDMLESDTDDIVKMIILLFDPVEPSKAKPIEYPSFTAGSVVNTTTLTNENFDTVYNDIDGLLDQFVKEGGSYKTIGGLISSSLYTNENVNALVTSLYKTFEEQGLSQIMTFLGIDVTPSGVGSRLREGSYSDVKSYLTTKASWSEVNLSSVDWGFSNGSKTGFQKALTAALRPLLPLFRTVLCENDLVVMGSITIKGTDGYNTAIIPILEALGCSSSQIMSYRSFKADSDGDGVIENVLDPVFSLLDNLCKKPVKTLIDKLPNIVYFMNSGSLEKCIENLLLPVTSIFNRVPGVIDFEMELPSLSGSFDVNELLGGMVSDIGVNVAEFDINTLASLGNATEKESKSIINGKNVKYTYIEADKGAIILSLLKVIAATLKMPGNETLLVSSAGAGGGMAFDTSAITSQFADMSEDELIVWLFNLFFKERVKIEIVTDDNYVPHIIYTPAEEDNDYLYVFLGYLGVCLIVGIILLINRKRLYGKVDA